jgi:hypothetical protein
MVDKIFLFGGESGAFYGSALYSVRHEDQDKNAHTAFSGGGLHTETGHLSDS